MFEKLEEAFDLIPAQKPMVQNVPVSSAIKDETPEDIKDKEDQELARQTFRKMIQKSENMLDVLTQIAEGTEHPRAFEVAANLVKTIADVASKLDEVSSRRSKVKEKAPESASTNINHNHLYVGSSEELMKLIRGVKLSD
jgi:hypothetical protein